MSLTNPGMEESGLAPPNKKAVAAENGSRVMIGRFAQDLRQRFVLMKAGAKRLAMAAALALLPVCGFAKDSTETAGDILAYLMPATTHGATFYLHDEEGRWQFSKAFVSSFAVTLGLKYSIDKERPDGSDNHSFPSGHSTVAFQSAHFIGKRYGWHYGVPAYAAAAFVGYSRVHAKKHFNSDVLAGAAIGIAGSEYFASRWEGLAVTPVTAGRGFMVSVSRSF